MDFIEIIPFDYSSYNNFYYSAHADHVILDYIENKSVEVDTSYEYEVSTNSGNMLLEPGKNQQLVFVWTRSQDISANFDSGTVKIYYRPRRLAL